MRVFILPSFAALLLCCLWPTTLHADSEAPGQEAAQPNEAAVPADVLSITPPEAYRMHQSGAPILDVRTKPEFDLVGHPVGATNIPYKTYPSWRVDPDFTGKVKSWAGQRTVLVICRSGKRSLEAARLLRESGIDAINVLEGFEGPKGTSGHRDTQQGWRNRNLPWEY